MYKICFICFDCVCQCFIVPADIDADRVPGLVHASCRINDGRHGRSGTPRREVRRRTFRRNDAGTGGDEYRKKQMLQTLAHRLLTFKDWL